MIFLLAEREVKKMKNVRSELDHYLEDDVLPKTIGFDVLNWWKANEPRYQTLQAIARDILAIHVSTFAFELAFSTSERLVSPHCSRLHPNTLETLMYAQSWFWSAEMKDFISFNLHIISSLLLFILPWNNFNTEFIFFTFKEIQHWNRWAIRPYMMMMMRSTQMSRVPLLC